ncbi:MAG: hypothetical protein KatS3mg113_0631 [Planctomycetaceae bacterium]|nr:MAG: hypothetical protein KatS3mg113_0631 [Planctomycetaceae bacterium]
MPRYLIAYDISDPKRLRKVARTLEKQAIRIQYSVFSYQGTRQQLQDILQQLLEIMNEREDVVQAWELPPGSQHDHALGCAVSAQTSAVILSRARVEIVAPSQGKLIFSRQPQRETK